MASLVPVTLFQFKAIRNLPDPPGSLFDSERITTSRAAFPLGIPDGALGLVSYGTTLALLVADTPSRPILHKVVQAKLLLDGGMAVTNTVRQLVSFKKGLLLVYGDGARHGRHALLVASESQNRG